MEETVDSPGKTEEEVNSRSRCGLLWMLAVIGAFVFGLGTGYLIWALPLEARLAALQQSQPQVQNDPAGAPQVEDPAAAQPAAQQDVKRYDVPVDDDYTLGPKNAPITIIEFSDYECPFCQRWHQEVWPQIKAQYGDQVRLVYRDFPLYSIHPNAQAAAEAANCAGEQDSYYDYNELLFSGAKSLGRDTYEYYAAQLSLDLKDFEQCLDDQRYKTEVETDYAFASQLGVRSTPTFFINGLAVVGAQPFDVFQQVIDMELAGEIPQ